MPKVKHPRLSAELLEFVEGNLGAIKDARFCGWDHAESDVWELSFGTGQSAFLKCHRQHRKFVQELTAYTEWLPALGHTPKLIAHHTKPNALLLEKVPGELVETMSLAQKEEQAVYIKAGRFLRSLHDLPYNDSDDMTLADAWPMRIASWSEQAKEHVSAADIVWAKAYASEAIPALKNYSRVPCHRDYTARNWLVAENSFYVIDFEHAHPNLWLSDLERLWTDRWQERPDLKESFFEGYGKALTADDEGLMRRFAAFGAVITITWAANHGDDEFEQFGRSLLARLKAEAKDE